MFQKRNYVIIKLIGCVHIVNVAFPFGNLNEELEYVIQLLEENMMNIYVENLTDYSIKDAPPVVRGVIPTLENWYDTRDRLGSRLYERMENVDYE